MELNINLKDNTYTLAPATPTRTLEEVYAELKTFFASPRKTLSDSLSSFILGGGTEILSNPVIALPVFRICDLSGYNYSFQNKMVAEVRFGLTISGYILVQTNVLGENPCVITHYFKSNGEFAFSEEAFSQTVASVQDMRMDDHCPILNHIYNLLASEYAEANSGKANTVRAHTFEKFLRKLSRTRGNELAISLGAKDTAVSSLTEKMMATDLDPVLTWKERHAVFKGIKSDRSIILKTKRRAHQKNYAVYQLPVLLQDILSASKRFYHRPFDNLLGALDRLFIDPIRWFIGVVRNNMGYSIALGIYSPFTFFFITQPMNPHAMWAVGKVRTAYIETTDKVKNLVSPGSTALSENSVSVSGSKMSFNATPVAALSGAVAAVITTPQTEANNSATQPSTLDLMSNPFSKLFGGNDNNYSRLASTHNGILLSTDAIVVNDQSWEERMSNFKAMEISYEENLEIAPRLGRLEQMETQLNWPLMIESTWLETERYLEQIKAIELASADYSPAFLKYAASEKYRTNQIQLYLWDRNIRFILDHPFTVMDQSKEQSQKDYYVGRSFVLLRDMTQELMKKHSNLMLPKGYDAIDKLATHFQADYKSGNSILTRLKNNSAVFAQKDAMDTKELRAYMKRQWEILYLLQNKTQEASNFGLQLYNWSIRNAIWITQSVYSAKREELNLIQPLFKKGSAMLGSNPGVNSLAISNQVKRIDSQYEALFHMMVLEYTSIRKEIGDNLKKDIEATQRRSIIGNMESFLKDRETLLKEVKVI